MISTQSGVVHGGSAQTDGYCPRPCCPPWPSFAVPAHPTEAHQIIFLDSLQTAQGGGIWRDIFYDILRVSSKPRGRENKGPPGYCPKILLLKRAKMVLCPIHRSHREICTRNRPVSETKFLGDFWGPLSLPAPLVYC